MNHHSKITVLSNYESYGLDKPVIGFSLPSIRFNPFHRVLTFGDGTWIEVAEMDLVEIHLSEDQKQQIFPAYEKSRS